MQHIVGPLINLATDTIGPYGVIAVFLLMALESACIPIPSEVIMLLGGFQVAQGKMTLLEVTAAGVAGNMAGSWLAYAAGRYGGRSALERYGKYILLSSDKLDMADKWWARYGSPAVFFSRMLPVIRTFISLPAGIGRMPFARFSAYTLAGSIPWSLMLAFVGYKVGENWQSIYDKLHLLDYPVLAAVVLAVFYAIWRRRRRQAAVATVKSGPEK